MAKEDYSVFKKDFINRRYLKIFSGVGIGNTLYNLHKDLKLMRIFITPNSKMKEEILLERGFNIVKKIDKL